LTTTAAPDATTTTTSRRTTTRTIQPTTLPGLLVRNALEKPDAVALRKKHLGVWKQYSWGDYLDRVVRVGCGLLELGVDVGDKVAIQAENRPAWLFADLGIQGLGAVTVGIYPTSPAAEVEYLLSHSESVVLFAEDEEQLDKALEVRHKLPNLRTIVVIDPRGVKQLDDPMIVTLAQLEELGSRRDPDDWFARAADRTSDEIGVIVYTSGTTGPPKGAMLRQSNLLAVGQSLGDTFGEVSDRDEVLSYLPLCHIAERLFSIIDALTVGWVVNFGEGGESFVNDLREVQPTVFLGVPRVWEKMLAAVQIRLSDASRIKRANANFWLERGRHLAAKRMRGRLSPIDRVVAALGWLLLYRSVREKLGMSRVKIALSGAAPIAPQVLEFFWSIGVPVREGYGQTENTAMATLTPVGDVRLGTVGTPLPGVEVKIADDGEILTRSPGVFAGYFKNDAATTETIDADGWLHTGDVGHLDEDGHLAITDRKKDIIITAGGKNVSPSEIENKLKVSPYVREAIVVGDKRKYLVALIGIEPDTVGDWATRRRVTFTTYRDLTERPEVRELIQEVVDAVNHELAQVETLKAFALIPKELDQEEGELTATQKVKRAAISREYGELIESLYR
jgi:long-chain acyl-CoA synthetase